MPQPFSTTPVGLPFIELQSVDSTNNYARAQIHAGLAQHGMTIFAHEQVAGKGQRGKAWTSEKEANIALSVLIKPASLRLTQQFHLSACVAVAVHEFFMYYTGDDTKIKWPNDLYWQDRKAGGILIENIVGSSSSGAGNWDWSIIGIGININQTVFPPDLPNPVSLRQITGKIFEPAKLAKDICTYFEKYYHLLIKEGFHSIYSNYNSNLFKKEEKVKLRKENRVFEAVIKKVTPAGKLVVQHAIEEEFYFGELEWMI